MIRRLCFAAAACAALACSAVRAQDFVPQTLKYFPGKWVIKTADGTEVGSVDWKLVAGGKAIAGEGVLNTGGKTFVLAGWDAKEKAWIHNWFEESGAFGHIKVTQFQDNTYLGTLYFADANGEGGSSEWKNRLIDKDHFEVTEFLKGEKVVLHFHRK